MFTLHSRIQEYQWIHDVYYILQALSIYTVNSRIEAAASTWVRSPVRLIRLAQSQGAAYIGEFLLLWSITKGTIIRSPVRLIGSAESGGAAYTRELTVYITSSEWRLVALSGLIHPYLCFLLVQIWNMCFGFLGIHMDIRADARNTGTRGVVLRRQIADTAGHRYGLWITVADVCCGCGLSWIRHGVLYMCV